ncbi:hypothetical protein CSAL01_04809 [Colletotrichum salicis]|uniref:Uncharacterized protein n=1 Tax=Colletotrichum salicis TaxID=1209931 RepID=A0A135TS39_9PEZI|nr:hypothetical protein CSAL01_04809 [Colletotrichum salicis]
MWDASSGESRGGAGAGPTAITGLQLEGRVGPGADALSRSRSGTNNGSGGAGSAVINGHGQGGSGSGGGGIGRRTSRLKTTGSPQKKLTPPPQLRERNLLKSGSVSVAGSLSSVTGSVTREREGHLGGAHPYHRQSSTSTSQQPQPQHQHHTSTSTSSSTTTQQIRVHLRGGGSAGPHQHQQQYQPVQPYQYQVPGRERGPPPAPTSGAASRNRDTIANYNRLRRETQHSSTSTLHHQNYWPDNFRNPRGGLGIEHSNNATRSNSIATNPRNDSQPRTGGIQKLALEESSVAEE